MTRLRNKAFIQYRMKLKDAAFLFNPMIESEFISTESIYLMHSLITLDVILMFAFLFDKNKT